MAVTPERMTLAEFLKLPEVKPALELRNGVVSQKAWTGGPRSALQIWIGSKFYEHAELAEVAQSFLNLRVLLDEDSYVLHVVVYLWDRIPEDDNGNLPVYPSTPPDLIVEVMAPDRPLDAEINRCRELIAHGVCVAILINPQSRTVYTARPDDVVVSYGAGDAIDLSDVVPGFQIALDRLFLRLRARPPAC